MQAPQPTEASLRKSVFFLLPVIIFFEHLSHATIVFCHAFKMTQKMKQYMYVLMSCRKKVFPVPSAEGMAMLISEMLQYKILSAWQCTCLKKIQNNPYPHMMVLRDLLSWQPATAFQRGERPCGEMGSIHWCLAVPLGRTLIDKSLRELSGGGLHCTV